MNPGLALTVTQLPLKLVDYSIIELLPVKSEGHGFIYALRKWILSHLRIYILEEFIGKCVFNEFEINFVCCQLFISESREIIFAQLKRYFTYKVYNNYAADLLPVAAFSMHSI